MEYWLHSLNSYQKHTTHQFYHHIQRERIAKKRWHLIGMHPDNGETENLQNLVNSFKNQRKSFLSVLSWLGLAMMCLL